MNEECSEGSGMPGPSVVTPPDYTPWNYFKRGMKLCCPECGESPVFKPAREVKSFDEWLHPLEGCPRCGYKYEPEAGYFLISIWAINYGVVGGLGLALLFLVDYLFKLPQWQTMVIVLTPMPFVSFFFARHAKSLFLAMDHYFYPHFATKNEK
jgi:uncharacterized protein (DUF983 family)